MEQRKKDATATPLYTSIRAVLVGERGYTYIELTIALSVMLILIPAVFFTMNTLEAAFKKITDREKLQMEYTAFYSYVSREIKQGIHFHIQQGRELIIDMPTGESVCYTHRKRQVIRSVKKTSDRHFQGMTIILQHAYFVAFIPDPHGVYIDIGLQDWNAHIEFSTYVGRRVRV